MMLQVTSARHVLRRDPDAAEEALRSAEEVGRRSMRELRRTVALLRSDGEAELAPLPSAREIPELVDQARLGGLPVELRVRGDLSGSRRALVWRSTASRRRRWRMRLAMPRARGPVLGLELADGQVALVAETLGPAAAPSALEPDRAGYGLIGMRERAASLGGTFDAGPTPGGWRVSCRLPFEANGDPDDDDSLRS